MEEFDNIEKLFASKAKTFAPKTPEGSWERVSASLSRRRRRKIVFWWSAISAVLLSTLIIIFYNIDNEANSSKIKSVNSSSRPIKETIKPPRIDSLRHSLTLKPVDPMSKMPTVTKTLTGNSESLNSAQRSPSKIDKINDIRTPNNSSGVEEHLSQSQTTEKKRDTGINNVIKEPIESISATEDGGNKLITLEIEQSSIEGDDSAKFENKASPIIHNLITIKPFCFYLTIMAGVENNFRFGQEHLNTATAYSTNENPINSFAIGVDFSVQHNKSKFVFDVGVHRHNLGFEGDFKMSDPLLRFVNVQDFGITSAGIYSIADIENDLVSNHFSRPSYLSSFNKIKVKLNTVDFNLLAGYQFNFKRFHIKVGTGVNSTIITSNQVYVGIDETSTYLGFIEGLKPKIFGANLNMAFGYLLNQRINVGFNARYINYFSSINTSDKFEYIPYSYAIEPYLKFRIIGKR